MKELGFILLRTEDIIRMPKKVSHLNNIMLGLGEATAKVVETGLDKYSYSSSYPWASFSNNYPKINRGMTCFCVLEYGNIEYVEEI